MRGRGCVFWAGAGTALVLLAVLMLLALVLFAPEAVLTVTRLIPARDSLPGGRAPVVITPGMPQAARTPGAPRAVPAPSPVPTPAVSAAQVDFAAELLAPLAAESAHRRGLGAQADPAGYARRIDPALNRRRINFLVGGFGMTLERPYPPTYKGHITLYSLDLETLQIAAITLNHDIRAPEIERFHAGAGHKAPPSKLDRAYIEGGFDLMRQTVEDATGLNVDFQLMFEDAIVQRLVDDVFGGLVVDVPFPFDAEPIAFGETIYPALRYTPGRQKQNGLQVLQFTKGIDLDLDRGLFDRSKEPAARKAIVVGAVLDGVKQESANPIFWARLLAFLRLTLESKEIAYDFDAPALLFQTVGQFVASAASGPARGERIPFAITNSVFVVDDAIGDGGVQWLSASKNPIMVRELAGGVYVDRNMAVPLDDADPYADDLPGEYWGSVRRLVRQRLAAP